MGIIIPKSLNPGDYSEINKEELLEDVKFTIYKNNNRPKPKNKQRIIIISCFAEFGCETIGAMYCVPRICKQFPGHYKIGMGWYGREYLYRHLVDEFWEIKQEHQWLREYCRAFHHESKNLMKIEKTARLFGTVFPSSYLGDIAVSYNCLDCSMVWPDVETSCSECPYCQGKRLVSSLFADTSFWKKQAIRIPQPSKEKMQEASSYLLPNSVGIFARGRKCYGRNLQPEFYVKLIQLLKDMGYSPIWLGEKQSTLPCPVEDVVDLTRATNSNDLELQMAIVKQLRFTIQFWTASTRLAGMVGTPFILFESPDQILGQGQEGYRLNLTSFGNKKIVYSHYLNVFNDNDGGILTVKKAIQEVEEGNYEDLIGMVDEKSVVAEMLQNSSKLIGAGNGCIINT